MKIKEDEHEDKEQPSSSSASSSSSSSSSSSYEYEYKDEQSESEYDSDNSNESIQHKEGCCYKEYDTSHRDHWGFNKKEDFAFIPDDSDFTEDEMGNQYLKDDLSNKDNQSNNLKSHTITFAKNVEEFITYRRSV